MYLNKAILFGNLTRDPEQKALPSGVKVTSFSLATNRTWKDKNGAKQEDVQYHNLVAFGVQADLIGQYLRKGSSILVEGRIQTRSWDDASGAKKYRTEIVVDSFQFGPKREGTFAGAPASGSSSGQSQAMAEVADQGAPSFDTIEYPEEEINPDDIPF